VSPRVNSVFRISKDPGAPDALRSFGGRTPTFVVPSDSGGFRWWSSLRTLFQRTKALGSGAANYPLRGATPRRRYFRGRSFSTSLVFHLAAIFLIVYLHEAYPDSVSAFDETVSQPEVIYYRVPLRQLPKTLPHIAPAQPGGRPLDGIVPAPVPAAGSPASQNLLTIVSKPSHPDNNHQTIIQPSSPPDLKITNDLKLPNIILGKPLEAPKAPLQFNATAAKPTQMSRKVNADPAPTLTPERSDNPLLAVVTPPAFKPAMPVSVNSEASQRKSTSGAENVQAPNIASTTSGDSATLTVISTNPAPPAAINEIMLPPGNRSGQFSVSVSEGAVGSPGENRVGVTGAGSTSKGPGGAGSPGVGAGGAGGGGVSLSEGPVTITGDGANSIGSGMLGAALARGIVYPVPAVFNVRRNSLIVSAGPNGGGGLNIYGALHCGKIYTIFLPMPGKNWTMQYCPQGPDDQQVAGSDPTVAHFGDGLVPPQADSKYDFQRLALPPNKTGKLIILKGIVRADGLVDQIEVYQGVLQEMDDNARLAFSQWKFTPALRHSKPVSVQVLLGIPADIPSTRPAQ